MKFAVEDNQIILSIKNTIAEMPIENGGTFITSKTMEPTEHGIGLKNVEEVIEKYNGSYVIDYNDKMFGISIIIPV